jgi:hypothetical protein
MMIGLGQVQDFCAVAGAIKDATALSDLMAEITKAMGFRHYALVHHVDLKPAVRSVHIVDYPQDWVERFRRDASMRATRSTAPAIAPMWALPGRRFSRSSL